LRTDTYTKTANMRFQDWDVLLFPADSQTPFKEFKTACYTTTDTQSMRRRQR